MSEFKREERYIVIKRKNLTKEQEDAIRILIWEADVSPVECVVVESNRSIYEPVWDLVEKEWEKRHKGLSNG